MPLTDFQVEQLAELAQRLVKWNKTFNFISRQDIHRLVPRHILDSLCGVGLLRGSRVLDLGSGAGLPGLVLAIAAPQIHFTLVDRSERRMRFCSQMVRELKLTNVDVWTGDVADYLEPEPVPKPVPKLIPKPIPKQRFDTVVARAVATPPVVWDMVRGLLAEPARVLIYSMTTTLDADLPEQEGDGSVRLQTGEATERAAQIQAEIEQPVTVTHYEFDIPRLANTHVIYCVNTP